MGNRFCGCQGYNRDDPDSPDSCRFSRPLPGRGYEIWKLEQRCRTCGVTPRVKVKPFRGRTWELCLNDDCPDMVEMRRKREERQAARAAKEALKEADGAAKEGEGGDKPPIDTATTATRRRRKATRSGASAKR